MKKLFLTGMFALTTMIASAQFTAVSNINEPNEDESWGVSNFTDNLGLGYQVTDNCMVGVLRNGEDYDLFARYNLNETMYLSATMPTENATDNLRFGIGYSFKFWNDLYIEPNYSIAEEEGEFNVGMAYKF